MKPEAIGGPRETLVDFDVLIVGGGHGGAYAAMALRRFGFDGSVAIVSREPDPPYERPPLSKDYLAGERGFDRLLIRPAGFWAEHRIDLLLGEEAVAVDPAAHRLGLAGGGSLGYGSLVWSAGGRARRLTCPGHDLAGVHVIRSRSDVDTLKAELGRAARVAVIGGGYIGLETAAVLAAMGKTVTVLEAADRLLARVASRPLSDFLVAEHRRHGVEVALDVSVDAIEARDGAASGVRLADGRLVPADLVIVGIGIEPVVEPLLAAGAGEGGLLAVDRYCRTGLPDIWAIGDCVHFPQPFAAGAPMRVESVQNAQDQANAVARSLTSELTPYDALPWFWSNQYDLKLQSVGLSLGHDDIVVRGDPAEAGFSLLYLKEGRVIALDCVNAVRDYVQGRALILGGAVIPSEKLADPALPLKSLTG
jgi:3-phenylpropionate/trans-cinnamate dioxygenase ferredoxin reductase subunit